MKRKRILYKCVSKKNKSLIIHPNSKYCLDYEKGKTITALERTLGVFCFDRRSVAEIYANYWKGKVIRVTPIGKVIRPEFTCPSKYSREISKFYKNSNPYIASRSKPDRTVVCQKIKVLE